MQLPRILNTRTLARSRLFHIEAVDLLFSNGARRTYERLPAVGEQAVIVVAVNDNRELLLIREYAAGFHEYQLTLPKGAAEPGETLVAAAGRELAEETGHGARQVQFVKNLTLAPGHMGFTINVMFATGLFPDIRPADEPEPPVVAYWPVAALDTLVQGDAFRESRAIAALALCRGLLHP